MSLYKLTVRKPHSFHLFILAAFASLGAALITPALPKMSQFFQVEPGLTKLTVTLFLMGYAVGQLIYGPLANRFGRKQALYIGIIVATIGSVFSILSEPMNSFLLLIIGRAIEALGMSCGLVVSYTIINDFYYPKQAKVIVSILMISFSLMPGLAVLIGGLIVQYSRWVYCFYFLLVYGILLYLPAYFLPETLLERDKYALKFKTLMNRYIKAFKNRNLISYSLIYGLCASFTYVFAIEAPFIAKQRMGLTALHYGIWSMLPYVGLLLGAVFSTWLAKKNLISPNLILKGEVIAIIGVLVLSVFFVLNIIDPVVMFGLLFIVFLGVILIMSIAASLAPVTVADKATASAVMGFIGIFLPVMVTFLVAVFHTENPLILPLVYIIVLICIFPCYWFANSED